MATWDDVRRVALGRPAVTERSTSGDAPAWRVRMRDKAFACLPLSRDFTQPALRLPYGAKPGG